MIFSGGSLGGQDLEWRTQGTLNDDREYMVIENEIYSLSDDGSYAIFVGYVE